MFKQVYARDVYWKPSCRRHLFRDAVYVGDAAALFPGMCVCTLVPDIRVKVWRCDRCELAWLVKKSEVLVCPLPTSADRARLNMSSGSSVQMPTMFATFPEIWGFLTCPSAPDGSKRQMGRLSLSFEGTLWTISLNDPTTGLYAALTSQDIEGLILMVESRFADGTMPWKVSKYQAKVPKPKA
jgi:hypothetical protein